MEHAFPKAIQTTANDLNKALNEIQSIQTDVLALKKRSTKLLAKSYTLPAQSIEEGKKLLAKGFAGVPLAFSLGGKVKSNIEITQKSGILATDILKETKAIIDLFQNMGSAK